MKSTISEREFTSQVIQYAKMHGWRVAHFRAARTDSGWRTPVQGDGAGFPDLILVRGSVMMAAELKVGRNKATAGQVDWLEAFRLAGVRIAVWYPGDWGEIERTLGR